MPANNSKHLVQAGDVFHRLTVMSFSHHDKRWRRHYLVHCDCGNEKTVQGTLLRSGNTRSCGCLAKEVKATKRKPDNGGELTAVILGYKRHAARRGLAWNLSREHVRDIVSKLCHYCGSDASNKKVTKNTRSRSNTTELTGWIIAKGMKNRMAFRAAGCATPQKAACLHMSFMNGL